MLQPTNLHAGHLIFSSTMMLMARKMSRYKPDALTKTCQWDYYENKCFGSNQSYFWTEYLTLHYNLSECASWKASGNPNDLMAQAGKVCYHVI